LQIVWRTWPQGGKLRDPQNHRADANTEFKDQGAEEKEATPTS
jgi:hypothetical protein